MGKKQNVILICTDQWRGDCLSIDDHPIVHTPYLDNLALEGCRFGRAYSATPTCIPARAALFTGLKQKTHGRVGYQDGVEWNYPVTIAGEFSKHGYQTQAIGKMHVYPERHTMGFDNVILHDGYIHHARKQRPKSLIDDYIPWLKEQLGYDADDIDHGLNCNSYVARPWDKPEYTHPTNFITTKAIEFLENRDKSKPFFLYLSYHRPHPPLDPPAWAFEQYMRRELRNIPKGDWLELWEPYYDNYRAELMAGIKNDHILHRAQAGYYGHLTHIDHQINRLIEIIMELGEHDNTYYCFTSDHGDMHMKGQHGFH